MIRYMIKHNQKNLSGMEMGENRDENMGIHNKCHRSFPGYAEPHFFFEPCSVCGFIVGMWVRILVLVKQKMAGDGQFISMILSSRSWKAPTASQLFCFFLSFSFNPSSAFPPSLPLQPLSERIVHGSGCWGPLHGEKPTRIFGGHFIFLCIPLFSQFPLFLL